MNINLIVLNLRCEKSVPACADVPCQHGGVCHAESETRYFCDCPRGYSGRHCEVDIGKSARIHRSISHTFHKLCNAHSNISMPTHASCIKTVFMMVILNLEHFEW